MTNVIEISHLSRDEKLKIMEAIWEDLSRDQDQVESPNWHQKVLEETERRFKVGQERSVDWKDANQRYSTFIGCWLKDFPMQSITG
jgi:hypothetical protein